MKTLPIALVLCCGLTGIGLAGCQTVDDDGYYGRSYSTVEYRTGYVGGYDYDYGYRAPVRRPPPRYVVQRPPPPPPPVWHGGQRPPPVWNGGTRPPPPVVRPPGNHRPPVAPYGGAYVPPTSDIGR